MALSLTFNSSPILPVHINPSQFKSLIPLLILTMATPCQATLVVPEEWTNPTFPFLTLATFNVGGNFFGKISQLRSLAEEVDVVFLQELWVSKQLEIQVRQSFPNHSVVFSSEYKTQEQELKFGTEGQWAVWSKGGTAIIIKRHLGLFNIQESQGRFTCAQIKVASRVIQVICLYGPAQTRQPKNKTFWMELATQLKWNLLSNTIIAGDFNAYLDHNLDKWNTEHSTEQNDKVQIFQRFVLSQNLLDVFRELNPDTREWSHRWTRKDGSITYSRIDGFLCSSDLINLFHSVQYRDFLPDSPHRVGLATMYTASRDFTRDFPVYNSRFYRWELPDHKSKAWKEFEEHTHKLIEELHNITTPFQLDLSS